MNLTKIIQGVTTGIVLAWGFNFVKNKGGRI